VPLRLRKKYKQCCLNKDEAAERAARAKAAEKAKAEKAEKGEKGEVAKAEGATSAEAASAKVPPRVPKHTQTSPGNQGLKNTRSFQKVRTPSYAGGS
jgi:hypothetical protein